MEKCRVYNITKKELIDWDGVKKLGNLEKLIEDDNFIVMPYVGLCDGECTEIYVNDIVKNEKGEVGIVIFSRGGYVMSLFEEPAMIYLSEFTFFSFDENIHKIKGLKIVGKSATITP